MSGFTTSIDTAENRAKARELVDLVACGEANGIAIDLLLMPAEDASMIDRMLARAWHEHPLVPEGADLTVMMFCDPDGTMWRRLDRMGVIVWRMD